MRVSGDALLHAPIEQVWQALNDPAVLVRTIPGCERLEAVGPDVYTMTVTAGVASIKGTYSGEVKLSDQQPPASFVMTASGAGAPGTVSTDVRVHLDAVESGTRLTYDADAVVGGMVGGVGQRMLTSVAKKMAAEFFAAVDDVLTGKTAVTVPAASQTEGVFVAPTAPAPGIPGGFAAGAVFGAAIALAGVVVGAGLARRRR